MTGRNGGNDLAEWEETVAFLVADDVVEVLGETDEELVDFDFDPVDSVAEPAFEQSADDNKNDDNNDEKANGPASRNIEHVGHSSEVDERFDDGGEGLDDAVDADERDESEEADEYDALFEEVDNRVEGAHGGSHDGVGRLEVGLLVGGAELVEQDDTLAFGVV